MQIKEYIAKNKKNINDGQLNIENILETTYLPFQTKRIMTDAILDSVLREESNNIISYDRVDLDMKFDLIAFEMYTTLELSEDEYNDYDLLISSGLLSFVFDYLEKEISRCKLILFKELQNKMIQNSIENIVATQMNKITKQTQEVVDHVNLMLDKGDPNKIAKYLSKGVEKIAAQIEKVDVNSIIKNQIKR